MRALVQRVSRAAVRVEGEEIARIGPGLLVLLGVARGDTPERADRVVRKVLALRVFGDGTRPMQLSVRDTGGDVLCVSQFTLYGDTSRGNRPNFSAAAGPPEAEELYERVRSGLGAQGGRFGAHMEVELTGDGPVTLLLEA